MARTQFMTNRDLFYSQEWSAENLYFWLYSMFDDYDTNHFAWRIDSEVCSWDHDQAIAECINFLDEAIYDAPDIKTFFEQVLRAHVIPSWLKCAVDEVCTLIGADQTLAEYTES